MTINKLLTTCALLVLPLQSIADTLEHIPFDYVYEGQSKSHSEEKTNSTYIYPGVLTRTPISISDQNLLTCRNGKINDRVFSAEKPLIFTPSKNKNTAFIKLQAKQNTALSV